MAVESVNNDPSLLPDHELVLLVHDTQCKVDVAMKHFVQYVSNKTHPIAGIVGQSLFYCSGEHVLIALNDIFQALLISLLVIIVESMSSSL